MTDREFGIDWVRRADHGPRQSAAVIVCASCGERDHVINNGPNRHMPPVFVAKRFAQAGWMVGAGPKADRCPKCAAKLRAPKPALKIVPKEPPPMAEPKLQSVTTAEVPADQKRRINAKLFDVYEGPEIGYARGWSDQKVATELGVPRALVSEIRDQFHGPARDNADTRELLERADVLFGASAELEAKAGAISADIKALLAQVGELRKTAEAIRKSVAA